MLPDYRDLAALPTSWALTIWDALPVFLSVEVAIVIVISVLVRPLAQERIWTVSGFYVPGGVVFLSLFDTRLTIVAAAISIARVAATLLLAEPNRWQSAPGSPGDAIRQRGADLIWSVITASAVAAIIKIIVGPAIDSGSPAWIVLGFLGGLISPGPLGVAAIPALATLGSSNSLWPPAIWFASAAIRPFLIAGYRRRRSVAASITDAG